MMRGISTVDSGVEEPTTSAKTEKEKCKGCKRSDR